MDLNRRRFGSLRIAAVRPRSSTIQFGLAAAIMSVAACAHHRRTITSKDGPFRTFDDLKFLPTPFSEAVVRADCSTLA
ncbi:hypothetical protein ROA7450_01513 [Roseovarius albus]|uniref:Uncharacterized protein n=1 Tax=Roseovarius albus TaxID=1247867 RepID=A0A1X6YXZ1_9RHOB|nr:hypothetical protein ROA7450_01513 [Roseovarius albus]